MASLLCHTPYTTPHRHEMPARLLYGLAHASNRGHDTLPLYRASRLSF